MPLRLGLRLPIIFSGLNLVWEALQASTLHPLVVGSPGRRSSSLSFTARWATS